MRKPQPIVYNWRRVEVVNEDGEVERVCAMVPVKKYRGAAHKQFREGGEYALGPIEQRNMALHNWFFAQLKEYWDNLPESAEKEFKKLHIESIDHFREWCLIRTGWYNVKIFDFDGDKRHRERSALRLAKFIRVRNYAEFNISEDSVVSGKYAKSQAVAEMEPADFEASAKAVLELAGDMVGVTPAQMRKHAGRHA